MKLKVGSRESKLAIIQSNIVIDKIKEQNKEIDISLITMKTTGDIILDKTLDKIGGKGLFVKEIDNALVNGIIDISVHSLKDIPMQISSELPIISYIKRENPLDVLILPKGKNQIDKTKPIGTSSKRRTIQLQKIYTEHKFKPIRGNLITRLQRLDDGEYSALVLAYAGIKRLGMEHRISRIFTQEEVVPACCQGIIAVQGKKSDKYSFLLPLNDEKTECEAKCERAFVRELNGGCSKPICAFSTISGDGITLTGFYASENEELVIKKTVKGNKKDNEKIAVELAHMFKEIINGYR